MSDFSGDFESIASEEDISIASDRSGTYDPTANDSDNAEHDNDNMGWRESSPPWQDTGGGSSSRSGSRTVPGLPLKSALSQRSQQQAPSSSSAGQDKSDDYGEYADFADDFETESVSSRGSRKQQQKQQQPQQGKSPRETRVSYRPASSPPAGQRRGGVQEIEEDTGAMEVAASSAGRLLPSLDSQALHAEVGCVHNIHMHLDAMHIHTHIHIHLDIIYIYNYEDATRRDGQKCLCICIHLCIHIHLGIRGSCHHCL